MRTYDTNNYGKVEIVKQVGETATVKFVNTGYVREVSMSNLRAGKVKDCSVKYTPEEEVIDEVWSSNSCGDFRVIKKVSRQVTVMFLETGTVRTCHIENAKKGKVMDPYIKSVYGIGVRGEFNKKITHYKQADQLWRNMLKRCYSEKDTRGYYGKAFVCLRWQYFPNFLEDLPKLEGFDKWLQGSVKGGEKYNLDKDSLIKGDKYYSNLTCRFLPEHLNKSLTTRSTKGFDKLTNYLNT